MSPEATARWLGALRGRLALDRVAIGGHSFGGAAALTTAAKHLREPAQDAVRLGACFALDPAVDWVPRVCWEAIGYDGHDNDGKRPDAPFVGAAPLVASRVPLFNVWSEQWRRMRSYQQWSSWITLADGAARPAASLAIQGCGHQGLCDLAHTLPHWLNLGLGNSLGTKSHAMGAAVEESVLAFLRNADVLDGPHRDLEDVATTMGHVQA